ncbi:hypothetical protein PISMIDRAFT_44374, partial [Pisolithus microcarpus 441]
GDNGNFKSPTYHATALHISQHLTSGPAKSAVMVRNKWISHVRKSGCHWDNIHGAGVQGKFDGELFEIYAKNHSLICLFKNSGWEFYKLMLDIMPNG